MKVLVCAYRPWGIEIYNELLSDYKQNSKLNFTLLKSTSNVTVDILIQFDLIFFIGWSEMIPKEIYNIRPCIILHPSLLPKFRGGSPIQNQIISGVNDGGITLFIANDIIDGGDILRQTELSLRGSLSTILKRISIKSTPLVKSVIDEFLITGSLEGIKQSEKEATFCKRRKPSMSEIRIDDLSTYSAKDVYNLVRCLQPPYPRAFIVFADGSRLELIKVKVKA